MAKKTSRKPPPPAPKPRKETKPLYVSDAEYLKRAEKYGPFKPRVVLWFDSFGDRETRTAEVIKVMPSGDVHIRVTDDGKYKGYPFVVSRDLVEDA